MSELNDRLKAKKKEADAINREILQIELAIKNQKYERQIELLANKIKAEIEICPAIPDFISEHNLGIEDARAIIDAIDSSLINESIWDVLTSVYDCNEATIHALQAKRQHKAFRRKESDKTETDNVTTDETLAGTTEGTESKTDNETVGGTYAGTTEGTESKTDNETVGGTYAGTKTEAEAVPKSGAETDINTIESTSFIPRRIY